LPVAKIGEQLGNFFTMPMKPMEARDFASERLQGLFNRLLHQDPAKVYVADMGLLFQVNYKKKVLTRYDGALVFILLPHGDEFVLCTLKRLGTFLYKYTAKEVPLSVSRVGTRTFQIDSLHIIAHLELCSKKSSKTASAT
jgi:hypothetical protein